MPVVSEITDSIIWIFVPRWLPTHQRWPRCPSRLWTIKIIFVYRFCCSSGHACFPAESFFVRKLIRAASGTAALSSSFRLLKFADEKDYPRGTMISPKTANINFVRKNPLEGTYLSIDRIWRLQNFSSRTSPVNQIHRDILLTKTTMENSFSSGTVTRVILKEIFRSHIVFLKLDFDLPHIIDTKLLVKKEDFKWKQKKEIAKTQLQRWKAQSALEQSKSVLPQGTFHSYWNPPKAAQNNLLQINSRR